MPMYAALEVKASANEKLSVVICVLGSSSEMHDVAQMIASAF